MISSGGVHVGKSDRKTIGKRQAGWNVSWMTSPRGGGLFQNSFWKMKLLFVLKVERVKGSNSFNHDTQGWWCSFDIQPSSLYCSVVHTFRSVIQGYPSRCSWRNTITGARDKGSIPPLFLSSCLVMAATQECGVQRRLEQSQQGLKRLLSVTRNPQTEKSMKLNHFPFVPLADCSVHACCSAICLFSLSSMHQLAANCG